MTIRVCLLFALALVSPPRPLLAQQPPPQPLHWGLAGSFAPWAADDRFRGLYDARSLDFSGSEFRVGVARGGTRLGEFAFLFVRKRIDEGSTLTDIRRRSFAIGPGVHVTGLMAEQFAPVGTIARRVQLGFVIAAGAGRASGVAFNLADRATLDAQQVLRVFAQPRRFQPLARAELAVAAAIAPRTKLRVSGGFNWPGRTQVSVTAMHFFGE